jgi:LacI family transcriptional regulator
MSTLRDVARRADVAPITASRVLNRSGSFSDAARARVEAAAAELGYVPNRVAQSLRSRRTHMIGLVLTDITNPFWTTIARAVEDVTSARGYHVIICNTDESDAKQKQYLDLLLQTQVDGLLLVPASDAVEEIARIQQRDVPVVVLDRTVPLPVDVIRADSEGGAHQLTEYLLKLGHHRIAVLSGPRATSVAIDRVAGCVRALEERGLAVDPTLIFHGEFTQESGTAMTRQALFARPRPTALFAVNNFIAIGAIRAVRQAGLRIPEDIALVGFDDLPEHLVLEPFLTVAAQPAYEMGRRAAERLLDRLTQDGPHEYQEVVLPTPLIVRHSSGGSVSEKS